MFSILCLFCCLSGNELKRINVTYHNNSEQNHRDVKMPILPIPVRIVLASIGIDPSTDIVIIIGIGAHILLMPLFSRYHSVTQNT